MLNRILSPSSPHFRALEFPLCYSTPCRPENSNKVFDDDGPSTWPRPISSQRCIRLSGNENTRGLEDSKDPGVLVFLVRIKNRAFSRWKFSKYRRAIDGKRATRGRRRKNKARRVRGSKTSVPRNFATELGRPAIKFCNKHSTVVGGRVSKMPATEAAFNDEFRTTPERIGIHGTAGFYGSSFDRATAHPGSIDFPDHVFVQGSLKDLAGAHFFVHQGYSDLRVVTY